MNRKKIVLYNPQAVFYTMPLALMAIGSTLDTRHYDVRLIDGRIESSPIEAILSQIDGAICFCVTVLSGAPILDALKVSQAVKTARPDLTVVWGGWHPSLFPKDCLSHPAVDIVVQGQGEPVFPELVERLANRIGLKGLSGICIKENKTNHCPPASPAKNLTNYPAVRYEMIPVNTYFNLKGKRQLDYISSMGCMHNCAFCADPLVFKRRWRGLEPQRVLQELALLNHRYKLEDVNFQDEAFFTSPDRALKIAQGFIKKCFGFTWAATMRVDQATRIGDSGFATLKKSGLRRVNIGAESGHQDTLNRLNKKVSINQVYTAADLCRRHNVSAVFSFIVGFPNESIESIQATIRMAKALRAMHISFETPIFFYKPYPGTHMADELGRTGYPLPATLEEWAAFDYVGTTSSWVSERVQRLIERFAFYNRFAWESGKLFEKPLKHLARWRLKHDVYSLPIEHRIYQRLSPQERLS